MPSSISGFLLLCIAVAFAACAVHGRSHPDQVTSLPGLKSSLDFQHFAGYLNVNLTNNRNLFYWFTKASNATTDLVLWLNGGPGCSSVSGFFTENGPFVVGPDGNIKLNDFAWNTRANMLWLEAPAGVGFSYSDVKDDYNTDDTQTAADNVAALVAFMNKFPEHASNNLYLTGESYAGHYVPTLAKAILDHNAKSSSKLNLQGFAVGNPLTNEVDDFNAPMVYYLNHNMLSPAQYSSALAACKGDFSPFSPDQKCQDAMAQSQKLLGQIDPYDIFNDICLNDTARMATQRHRLISHIPLFKFSQEVMVPPCIDKYTRDYLNRPDVQSAIHAHMEKGHLWNECSDVLNYDFNHDSMLPLYEYFLNSTTLRVWVYSGNFDSVLPTTGTMNWIARLGRTVLKEWQPWTGKCHSV